jgi:WD40 repeat protein
MIKAHTKFVQDVRYAQSGDHFASVGSDGKIFLYDGKAGEILGEFSEGHSGTAVSQARVLRSYVQFAQARNLVCAQLEP